MSETKLQYQQRMQRKFDRQQDQIADLTNENFRLKKKVEALVKELEICTSTDKIHSILTSI